MTGERRTFNFSKLPEIVGTGEYFSKNGGKNWNYRYKSFLHKEAVKISFSSTHAAWSFLGC
jgi:hypothetical protein